MTFKIFEKCQKFGFGGWLDRLTGESYMPEYRP